MNDNANTTPEDTEPAPPVPPPNVMPLEALIARQRPRPRHPIQPGQDPVTLEELTQAVGWDVRGLLDISDKDLAWLVEATLYHLRLGVVRRGGADFSRQGGGAIRADGDSLEYDPTWPHDAA